MGFVTEDDCSTAIAAFASSAKIAFGTTAAIAACHGGFDRQPGRCRLEEKTIPSNSTRAAVATAGRSISAIPATAAGNGGVERYPAHRVLELQAGAATPATPAVAEV
jgi:hypothetical protein